MSVIHVHPTGYQTISEVLTAEDSRLFSHYFQLLDAHHNLEDQESKVAKISLNKARDIVVESLLLDCLPIVEKATGKKLYPTYGFLRKYLTDSELTKHKDRPSSEIGCTLTIDYQSEHGLWPIYFEKDATEHEVLLDRGELLIYRGAEMTHWRDKFKGEFSLHAFFFYVEQNGDYQDFKYDKREKVFGKTNFREVLHDRIATLEQLNQLDSQTQLIKTVDLPYSIEQEGVACSIQINGDAGIRFPAMFRPFMMEIMAQKEGFSLSQLSHVMNEKACLTLLKPLIVKGYFHILHV